MAIKFDQLNDPQVQEFDALVEEQAFLAFAKANKVTDVEAVLSLDPLKGGVLRLTNDKGTTKTLGFKAKWKDTVSKQKWSNLKVGIFKNKDDEEFALLFGNPNTISFGNILN